MATPFDPAAHPRWAPFITQVRSAAPPVAYVVAQPVGGGPNMARLDWTVGAAAGEGFTLGSTAVREEARRRNCDEDDAARILALRQWAERLLHTNDGLRLRAYYDGGLNVAATVDLSSAALLRPPPPGLRAPAADAADAALAALDALHAADEDSDEDPEGAEDAAEPDTGEDDGAEDDGVEDEDDADPEEVALAARLDAARARTRTAELEAEVAELRAKLASATQPPAPLRGRKGKGRDAPAPTTLTVAPRRFLDGIIVQTEPGQVNFLNPPVDLEALAEIGIEGATHETIKAAYLQLVHATRIGMAVTVEAAAATNTIYSQMSERLAVQNSILFDKLQEATGIILASQEQKAADALAQAQHSDRMETAARVAQTLLTQGKEYLSAKQLLDALEKIPEDKRTVILARMAKAAAGSDADDGGGHDAGLDPEHDAASAAVDAEDAAIAAVEAAEAVAAAAAGDEALAQLLQQQHVLDALRDPAIQNALKDPTNVTMLRTFLGNTPG